MPPPSNATIAADIALLKGRIDAAEQRDAAKDAALATAQAQAKEAEDKAKEAHDMLVTLARENDAQAQENKGIIDLQRSLAHHKAALGSDPLLAERAGDLETQITHLFELQLMLSRSGSLEGSEERDNLLRKTALMMRLACVQYVALAVAAKHVQQGKRFRFVQLYLDNARDGASTDPEVIAPIGEFKSLLRINATAQEKAEKQLKTLFPAGQQQGQGKRPWTPQSAIAAAKAAKFGAVGAAVSWDKPPASSLDE